MLYPFSYQLFRRVPFSPVLLALLLAFLFGGSYILIATQGGLLEGEVSQNITSIEFRATFTVTLLVAYLPMAQYYLIKWSQEHWLSLSKQMEDTPVFDFSLSRFWGVSGMLLQFIFFFSIPWFKGEAFREDYWSIRIIFSHVFVVTVGWFLYRLLVSLIYYAKQFSHVADRLKKKDIFNTTLAKIFVKQGVRSALLMVGFISICGNLIVAPGTRTDIAILTAVASSLCAIIALVIPAMGIQKRRHKEKQHQLQTIQKQIELLSPDVEQNDKDWSKLAALIALESRLQATKEWPFDASSISRFIFYMSIGLASWIGAALVEKILDAFIN